MTTQELISARSNEANLGQEELRGCYSAFMIRLTLF